MAPDPKSTDDHKDSGRDLKNPARSQVLTHFPGRAGGRQIDTFVEVVPNSVPECIVSLHPFSLLQELKRRLEAGKLRGARRAGGEVFLEEKTVFGFELVVKSFHETRTTLLA